MMKTGTSLCAIRSLILGITFMWISGCSGKARTEKIQATARGQALYQLNCQPCHEGKNLELVKQPPPLVGLFLHSTLPSGAPATDDAVRKTIMEGRGIMPPFQQRLSTQDINDLVRYLHALSKGARDDHNTAGHEIPGP